MNIIQVGMGPLGQMTVRHALKRPALKIVGAIDPHPEIAGKDLGVVCGMAPLGVQVSPTLGAALRGQRAEAALLMTVSTVAALEPQVIELAEAGLHVVSTCEELTYPWHKQPEVAARIDKACKAHGVACLGTGVNPGYLMDFLPSVLTASCHRVDRVLVSRVQDAAARRIPFQQKIGVGLSPDQFQAKAKEGTLQHVGLSESIHMIARQLGWAISKVETSLEMVLADRKIVTGYRPVEPGQARGVHQVGRGFAGGNEVITLDFLAAVGEPESYDRVEIQGEPSFRSTIAGGINGDLATCAIALNALGSIATATPGLKSMLDVPMISCRTFPAM